MNAKQQRVIDLHHSILSCMRNYGGRINGEDCYFRAERLRDEKDVAFRRLSEKEAKEVQDQLTKEAGL